jgi:hypothetical protein
MVIYKTIHLTTGKFYIGRDKHNNPSYYGSGTEIKMVIKNEGTINLKKEILDDVEDLEQLSQREEYWLNYYNAENNPMCYNRTNKAYGCSRQTEEGKKRISEALKGKKRSKEICKKISKSRLGLKRDKYKTRNDVGVKRGPNLLLQEFHQQRDRSDTFKPVLQYDLEMNLIKRFPSAKHAKNNYPHIVGIANCLTSRAKTSGGYIWKYE